MPSLRRDAGAVAPGQTWLVRAWKWGAGSLSAGAALVSILSSVRSITGAQQVRWIGVAPAADTAWAIGDTIQLATTITDGHGGVLPGVSVGWSSMDTSVASVDSAGTVAVHGSGATTIVAAAGGRIAQSRILVRQRPAAIRIFGDTLPRLAEGSATRLVARVVDARRHPVPGQSVTWRSADPSVAAIDSAARLTAVMAGRVVLVATGGDLTTELPLEVYPVPATITLLAGDNQHAPAGHRLAGPVRVQIVSRGGRPLPGVPVRFSLAEASGHVDRETDTTDAGGIVEAAWTIGSRPGRHRIVLAVEGDTSIATSVVADADPLPENTRIIPAGGVLTGSVGQALQAPVAVRVVDSVGSPVTDVPVSWAADGGGTIIAGGPRTDSIGEARARWTLGLRSGPQQAYLQVGSSRAVPRFTVDATALPGLAASLAAPRTASLRGEVGRRLPAAIEFRVADGAGNPVPGVPVVVRPASGSVSARVPVTDSTGRASVVWTLGSAAGLQRLRASVTGIGRPLELTAQARPGSPAKATLDGIPASAMAGRPLAQAVACVVTDVYGNAVPGVPVAFTARAGRVTPARVRTDAAGRAETRWTLGSTPGDQVLEASVKEGGRRVAAKVRALRPGKLRSRQAP